MRAEVYNGPGGPATILFFGITTSAVDARCASLDVRRHGRNQFVDAGDRQPFALAR